LIINKNIGLCKRKPRNRRISKRSLREKRGRGTKIT